MTTAPREIREDHPTPVDRRRQQPAFAIVAVLGVAAIAFFFGLGRLSLVGPDEPRFAEVAREMFATGDYVTPQLVGGTKGAMIANLIEVQFVGAGNWPLGAALSLMGMAMVAVIAVLFVVAARAGAKAAR